jgi:hypothetical protein
MMGQKREKAASAVYKETPSFRSGPWVAWRAISGRPYPGWRVPVVAERRRLAARGSGCRPLGPAVYARHVTGCHLSQQTRDQLKFSDDEQYLPGPTALPRQLLQSGGGGAGRHVRTTRRPTGAPARKACQIFSPRHRMPCSSINEGSNCAPKSGGQYKQGPTRASCRGWCAADGGGANEPPLTV